MTDEEYIEYLVIEGSLHVYGRLDITIEERRELFDSYIPFTTTKSFDPKSANDPEAARKKLLNMLLG